MTLDAILSATEGSTTTSSAAPKAPVAAPVSAPFLVKHETAETTLLALSEFYDARRDAMVSNILRTLQGYGAELEKRGTGMTSAHATAFLQDARRYLDAADSANASAALNRRFYSEVK